MNKYSLGKFVALVALFSIGSNQTVVAADANIDDMNTQTFIIQCAQQYPNWCTNQILDLVIAYQADTAISNTPRQYCVPEESNAQKMKQNVIAPILGWLRHHAELAQQSANTSVTTALKEMWPC